MPVYYVTECTICSPFTTEMECLPRGTTHIFACYSGYISQVFLRVFRFSPVIFGPLLSGKRAKTRNLQTKHRFFGYRGGGVRGRKVLLFKSFNSIQIGYRTKSPPVQRQANALYPTFECCTMSTEYRHVISGSQ